MLNEDLDIFLDVDEFATIAIINGRALRCIFDSDPVGSFGSDFSAVGVEGKRFTACFKDEDVAGLRHGTIITLESKNYKVIGVQPAATERFTDVELKEA